MQHTITILCKILLTFSYLITFGALFFHMGADSDFLFYFATGVFYGSSGIVILCSRKIGWNGSFWTPGIFRVIKGLFGAYVLSMLPIAIFITNVDILIIYLISLSGMIFLSCRGDIYEKGYNPDENKH